MFMNSNIVAAPEESAMNFTCGSEGNFLNERVKRIPIEIKRRIQRTAPTLPCVTMNVGISPKPALNSTFQALLVFIANGLKTV